MRTVDPVKYEQRRRTILSAAQQCFARDGLRGPTISGICAEAGMSPGHLYHYFENKEAILAAITEMVFDHAAEHFEQAVESSDALAALIQDGQDIQSPGDGRGVLFLDMLAEASRNPGIAKILQEHTRAMRDLLAASLREGQARGRVERSLDADVAASVLIGIIDGSKLMRVRDPELGAKETIAILLELITRFLAPR